MNHTWPKITSLPSSIPLRSIVLATVNVVLLFSVGFALDILIFSGSIVDSRLRLLMVALLVWQAQQSRATLLFFAMLLSLAIREPAGFENQSWIGSGCYCVIALVTLSWISRYRIIRNSIATSALDLLEKPMAADSSTNDSLVAQNANLTRNPMDYVRAIAIKLVPIPVFVLLVSVAAFLLYFQPISVNETPWLDWANAQHQVLWPGPSLIVLAMGIGIAMNELFWRRKTASQFRLMVRSIMIQSHYPDFLRIVRLLSKQKSSHKPNDPSQSNR